MSTISRCRAPRISLGLALAALGVAGCGAAPSVAPAAELAAPPTEPDRFGAERFDANVRALVAFGPRAPGSEALARARRWAEAQAPAPRAGAAVALVAPLATAPVDGAALAEQSSGAALALEAARALAAAGADVALVFDAGDGAFSASLAGAELALFVRHACGLPAQRDLLSHRVLRERFFRVANVAPAGFVQADAPHEALRAAGARRVVALDAPAAPGAACAAAAFGDALVRFVIDSTALLARGRSNSAPPLASQGP